MASKKFTTPDEYIGSFPPTIQTILMKIRKTVQKAVPDAEEVISYNIPAFKSHGWILYYSAYTNHFSLSFPPPFTVFEAFKQALAQYEQSKSAVRFPLNKPVPTKLIIALAQFRAKENIASEKLKVKKTKIKA
jgi:uncharacterized protein YdhG (YjbR/CyaY superfamily)